MPISWTPASQLSPSSARKATAENFTTIAGLTGLNLIDKPEINDALIRSYGNQDLTGFARAVGSFVPVSADKKEWFEEAKLHNVTTLTYSSGTCTAGLSGTGVFTFASDSTIRLYDVLRMDDTIVYVTAITDIGGADEVTVAPYTTWKATYTTAGTAVTTIIGNDYKQGSSAGTEWIESNVSHFESPFAIIKDQYVVHGSQMTNVAWVRVPAGKQNQGGWVWYLKGENDQRARFENYVERQMIEAEVATNTTVLNGAGVTGTEGLFSAIDDRGITGSGQITLFSEIQELAQEFEKVRGAEEYTIWSSIGQTQALDDMLKTETAIGAATSYGLFDNDENMALTLGFSGFKNSGYNFYYKKWKLANDTEMLGAHTFNAVFIPADTVMDAKSGEAIPSFSIGYKAAEGYSREIVVFLQGSAGLPFATNTNDNREIHYLTERNMCVAGALRYAKV